MTTDADDIRLQPPQTKKATVGHTAWQVGVANGAVWLAHNVLDIHDFDMESALVATTFIVPALTAVKTFVVSALGAKSAMAQQLQDLQEQLEQMQ